MENEQPVSERVQKFWREVIDKCPETQLDAMARHLDNNPPGASVVFLVRRRPVDRKIEVQSRGVRVDEELRNMDFRWNTF